jgi:hypothetical protein
MESEPPMGGPGTHLQGLAREVGERGEAAALVLISLPHARQMLRLGHDESSLDPAELSKGNQPSPGQDMERLCGAEACSGVVRQAQAAVSSRRHPQPAALGTG